MRPRVRALGVYDFRLPLQRVVVGGDRKKREKRKYQREKVQHARIRRGFGGKENRSNHNAAKPQSNADSGKGVASTAPSSAFGTFSPAGKRGGEGSRCWRVASSLRATERFAKSSRHAQKPKVSSTARRSRNQTWMPAREWQAHGPLIRLRHLLRRWKARGRRALDVKKARALFGATARLLNRRVTRRFRNRVASPESPSMRFPNVESPSPPALFSWGRRCRRRMRGPCLPRPRRHPTFWLL